MLVVVSMATIMPAGFLPTDRVDCLKDSLFEWTAGANTFFAENPTVKHAFMILAGFMMDVMVVTAMYQFAFKGTTWRLPLALCMNHALRFLCFVSFLSSDVKELVPDALPGRLPLGVPWRLQPHSSLRKVERLLLLGTRINRSDNNVGIPSKQAKVHDDLDRKSVV